MRRWSGISSNGNLNNRLWLAQVRSPPGPHSCGRAAVESLTQQKRVPGQQKWKLMLLSGNRSTNPVLSGNRSTGSVLLFDAASLNRIRGEHEWLVRQSHAPLCSSSGSESFSGEESFQPTRHRRHHLVSANTCHGPKWSRKVKEDGVGQDFSGRQNRKFRHGKCRYNEHKHAGKRGPRAHRRH